jgi:Fur family transcriptional regulator, ferric uptake regulator
VAGNWTATAIEHLRSTSGRSGTARRAVVEFLGRQDCCLSAQEIHDAVRTAGVHVGLASVYRTLEGLDRGGFVQRIDLGDGISRFEPALAGGEHHHHFVCDDCGKVDAFEDSALEAALEKIAGGKGYALEAHDVVLRGGCGDCRPAAV